METTGELHRTVTDTGDPTAPVRRPLPRLVVLSRTAGPAFVAAVAYVDPGNVATNMLAGSAYGTCWSGSSWPPA